MRNPFSKEQLRNYMLLYGAIVVIMVLFYLLNTRLNEQTVHEKKVFNSKAPSKETSLPVTPEPGGQE